MVPSVDETCLLTGATPTQEVFPRLVEGTYLAVQPNPIGRMIHDFELKIVRHMD